MNGELLEEIKNTLGFSRTKMAKFLGISPTTLDHYRAERLPISKPVSRLLRIVFYYEINGKLPELMPVIEYLLEREDER